MNEDIKTIQSVQRAIDIMNCVGDSGRKISLKEISTKLNLNINTTRGLVQTLLANGFLSKDVAHGTYSLGYEFLEKSKLLYQFHIQKIRDIAHPRMEQIAEKYGVASWLQVCFYKSIYTAEVLEASTIHYSYAPKSGANLPLYASASGKLRIAYMPENEREKVLKNIQFEQLTEYTITDRNEFERLIEQVYSQSYATEFEEVDIGISSVAVPIFDLYGELRGTLSIVAPSVKVKNVFRNVLADLQRAGTYISDTISKHH